MEISQKKHKLAAGVYLTAWFVLILVGIVAKRGFDHPDLVVFFHLPAAFFLVLGLYQMSAPFRKKNQMRMRQFEVRSETP